MDWTTWPLRGDGETKDWVRVGRDETKEGSQRVNIGTAWCTQQRSNISRASMISMADIVFRRLGIRIYPCIHPIPVQFDRRTLFARLHITPSLHIRRLVALLDPMFQTQRPLLASEQFQN